MNAVISMGPSYLPYVQNIQVPPAHYINNRDWTYEATRPRSPPCERAIYFREKRRRWHLKHTGAIGPTPALPTRYLEWDAWSFLTPPPLSPDSRETSDTMEQPVEVEDAGRGVRFFKRVSHGSSCARMDGAINNGIYYWQLHLGNRMYGTSIQVGIGTAEVRHASHAFKNIIGEDENGWGMSHKGVVWHNGLWAPYTEPFTQNEDTVIGVMFDGVAGTLGFFKDNRWMGVAFKGLDKVNKPLYPMVAATARNTKFTLLSARCDVGTLLDRCRSAVLRALHNPDDVESLPLPDPIRAFILEGVVTPTVLPITNPAQRLLM